MLYLLTIDVKFHQVKDWFFYDDQIINMTYVGKKNEDIQYIVMTMRDFK